MPTAIKVDDTTKVELDRLQARLTLALGRKPTLQEIVAQLTRLGAQDEERLARELGPWRPLTRAEIDFVFREVERLNALPPNSPPMSDEDIEIYEERGLK